MGATSLELFMARLDGILRNLIFCASGGEGRKGWKWMIFKIPPIEIILGFYEICKVNKIAVNGYFASLL